MTYEEEVKRKEAYDKIKNKMKRLTPTRMKESSEDTDEFENDDNEFRYDYQTKTGFNESMSNIDPATFRNENE